METAKVDPKPAEVSHESSQDNALPELTHLTESAEVGGIQGISKCLETISLTHEEFSPSDTVLAQFRSLERIDPNWILLDSGFSIRLFTNIALLHNIRRFPHGHRSTINTSAGSVTTNQICNLSSLVLHGATPKALPVSYPLVLYVTCFKPKAWLDSVTAQYRNDQSQIGSYEYLQVSKRIQPLGYKLME